MFFQYLLAVPAGEYEIEAATYDGSPGRATDGIQEFEQLFLEFLDAEGDVIDSTASTPDLLDGVEEAEWRGSVGTVVLDRDAVTIRATHSFAGQIVGSQESPLRLRLGTSTRQKRKFGIPGNSSVRMTKEDSCFPPRKVALPP